MTHSTKPRNRAYRCVVSVALLAAIVSCANESDPEPDPGPVPTTTTTETGRTVDPEPTPDNPSISLPSLPIGGDAEESSDSDHPNNQCVDVNWIVDQDSEATLKAGIEIEVTSFLFTPDIFVVSDAGCDDNNPSCTGFVFTEDAQVCNLAVDPTSDGAELTEDPTVGLTGIVNCTLEREECQAFADSAAEQNPSIPLLIPEVVPTDETTSPTDDLTDTSSG